MLHRGSKIAVAAASVGLLLASALPALGGAVSSGGPWSYTRQGVVCTFSGSHGSFNNHAYAETLDFNGGCAHLRVRLKSNPNLLDSGWWESVGDGNSAFFQDGRNGSTAVSSEHRAQNPFDLSWSGVLRPHAW